MLSLSSHNSSFPSTSQNDRERDWLPLRAAVSEFSLHPNTLRKYANAGKVNVLKLPSGKRLWSRKSLLSFLGSPQTETEISDSEIKAGKTTIPIACCIRVSSFGQSKPSSTTVDKSSLEHQEERIRSYIAERFKGQNVSLSWFKRVSSGMVFDNACFLKMVEQILSGKFKGGYLLATDFTRVARFGIKLIEHLCNLGGCKILFTLSDDEVKNEAESLTDEVLSILTHYTAKASGAKAALIIGVKVEPDVLKTILTLYNHHCSFPEISRQLEQRGMKGKDGRKLTPAICRGLVKRNKNLIPSLTGNDAALSPALLSNSFDDFCVQRIRTTTVEDDPLPIQTIIDSYRTWCFRQGLVPLASHSTFKTILKSTFPTCLVQTGKSGRRQYRGLVIVRERAAEVIEVEEVSDDEAPWFFSGGPLKTPRRMGLQSRPNHN